MHIQNLTSNDIDAIISLERDHAPDKPFYVRYDEKELTYIFNSTDTCAAFGMFDGEVFVGWGSYRPKHGDEDSGVFEISSVVVNSNYRRQGVGKQLLDHVFSQLKKRADCKKIYLTVSPKNVGALVLYLKNGFEIYDFKKDVYGPDTDRLYLTKE